MLLKKDIDLLCDTHFFFFFPMFFGRGMIFFWLLLNESGLVLQNQGEEISLRLRTDDLKGFRKYQSIKKTLLHELVCYSTGQDPVYFLQS